MKRQFLSLLALSAMVMGGCSKSEIDDGTINSTNVISFSTSANKLTKAPVLDNNFEPGEAFGVFAYYTKSDKWASAGLTEPNFMNNQEVAYTGSVWEYTPLKYWPNTSGEMISFFGYMPYSNATTASAEAGLPQIEFTQTMDAEKMLDLTVAQALDQKRSTSAVVLPFNHILTRLNFKGRVDHDLNSDFGLNTTATNVYVTDIKVLGTGNNGNSRMLSKATYMLADGTTSNGAWDYTSEEVAEDDLDVNPILDATDYTVGSASEVISGVKLNQDGDAATAQPLLQDDEYLFFIPTSENGVETEDDIKFAVSYTVVTDDDAIENNIAKSESTVILSMPNGTLKSEVAYNIIMTFGLDKVVVDAEAIEGWEPNPEEDVYTVVKGEVQTATEIEAMITEALDNSKDAVIDYNQAPAETLDININTTNASASNSITLNLIQQTGNVNITTDANYAGPLTINAPKATVTVNGGLYTNLTVWTASNTLKIAEGSTVNGLTINAGNVQVYGTLEGTITAGKEFTSSVITVMPDASYTATITSDNKSKITINACPTEDGVYYSVDGKVWDDDFTIIQTGKSITVIGVGSVTLSADNLTKIASKNFEEVDLGSVQYESTTFPAKFNNNKILKKIKLPHNIIIVSNNAFYSSAALESIDIPDSVTEYKTMAFYNCTSLKNIRLDNILTFGDKALGGTNLQGLSVVLNQKVTELPVHLFAATAIESVALHNGIETLKAGAFYGCTALKSVTIPSSIKNFGDVVFGDSSLESAIVPDNFTVPLGAFTKCSNFKSINWENIVKIEEYAFKGTAFSSIVLPNHIDIDGKGNIFAYMENLTSFEIEEGESPFNIGSGAISNNPNLTSLILPSNVLSLTTWSLSGNVKLSSIVCKAKDVIPTKESTFGSTVAATIVGRDVIGDKTLYVPADLVDDYTAETTDRKPLNVVTDDEGNITKTNENYWKTILQDKCNFKVVSIEDMPTVE